MDDLMNKLQNVLNDEESMKQITELAGMLASEMPKQETAQAENATSSDQSGGFSQLLSNLGGMLGSAPAPKNNIPNAAPPQQAPQSDLSGLGGGQGLDIAKLVQLKGIMEQANKSDKNVELLLALRPLLKEENQLKIDRLVKIFKLFAIYPALKESGLLGGDLFGLL